MISTQDYTNFLINHKLKPTQYLLLTLLYEREFKLISKYKESFSKEKTMIPREEIDDLVDRGFLTKLGDKYRIGEAFTSVFVDSDRVVKEVYSLYPPFITNGEGVRIPLTTMDRQIFKKIYVPSIMGSVEEHKKVILDLKYAIANGLITTGINKFVTSMQWEGFRKLRQPPTPLGERRLPSKEKNL